MFTTLITTVLAAFFVGPISCWEDLPQIPAANRAEFFVLQEDGGYKYGFDTGDGIAAKQSADAVNQVTGHYFYKNPLGQDIDLKYTSGVQGFVPVGWEKILPQPALSAEPEDPQANTGDASYNFNFDTPTYRRTESSDARGNIQGSFAYFDEAGTHDLSFTAGENTGFVATSGSLSKANGLRTTPLFPPLVRSSLPPPVYRLSDDGSYVFSYATDDSSREESADSANNVKGRYSYQNTAGRHDLSYLAGAGTGFQVTGGSLATPNGLDASTVPSTVSTKALPASPVTPETANLKSEDGSYSFSYSNADSSREESADSANNVKGRYSYQNKDGNHDLSYIAGGSSGFQVTGGSLATPNGLGDHSNTLPKVLPIPEPSNFKSSDGSYSFGYSAPDSSREESADISNNVKGRYSYQNTAGTHDLSYIAGASTGFQVTGGSLAPSNGLGTTPPEISIPRSSDDGAQDDQSNTGDASYSFKIDTPDYKRQESSDSAGNVNGGFSYSNSDGTHDLSFVAGSATGYLPTGGSLSKPPGLNENQLSTGANPQNSVVVPPVAQQSFVGDGVVPNLPSTKTTVRLDKNFVVHSYLPPSNEKRKFGYILKTV